MNKINFLFIILVSIFLASCQKDNEPVIIYDINDEFNIEIFQELNNSNSFFLKLTTLDEYPDNYRIEADVTNNNDKLELNIYRILKSNTASTKNVTLSKKLALNTLSLGTHSLDLIIRNSVVNEGAISITPATVELDFSTKQGITAKHYEVNRIDPTGYWGVAYIESTNHIIYLDHFMQKIKAVSTEFVNPKVGNYGYFSIDDQNKINLPLIPHDNYKTFYLGTTDINAVNSYLQDYKSYGVGFHATIYTAQGQVFHHTANSSPPTILQSIKH